MSQFQVRTWRRWAGVAGVAAIATALANVRPAYAQKVTAFDLDQAICTNDWSNAIGITSMLMADQSTPSVQRTSLLTLRRQLENYRARNATITAAQACDRTAPYLLPVATVPSVQSGASRQPELAATDSRYSTQLITESQAFALPVSMGQPLGLMPAAPVDLSNGFNVVSGHVGNGHQVYGFVARMGDRLDANLSVTQVMTGSLYTSDDSQLFIFDSQGRLLAAVNDTEPTPQSRISGMVMPKTDLYFAVVTSDNNAPVFGSDGRLTGWQDNGGGRFDYTLTLSGITPTSSLSR